MIIQCINCNKKFEVNSSLIPDVGRNIQCGSCNYTWFYQNINKTYSLDRHDKNDELITKKLDDNNIHLKKDLKNNVNLKIAKKKVNKEF